MDMFVHILSSSVSVEIKSEIVFNNTKLSSTASVSDASEKNIHNSKLQDGSVVKGEIVDISPKEAVIKLENGELVKGTLINGEGAKIGDTNNFTIKYNKDGKLNLDMQSTNKEKFERGAIEDILKSFDFKISEDNIKMVKQLLNNNFPINKDTLVKFNQALKLVGAENVDKAVFLVQNEMRINQKNVNLIDNFISGKEKILEQLSTLGDEIDKMQESPLKNRIVTELLKESAGSVVNGLTDHMRRNPTDESISLKLTQALKELPLSEDRLKELKAQLISEFPQKEQIISKTVDLNLADLKSIEMNSDGIRDKILEEFKKSILQPEKQNNDLNLVQKNSLSPEKLTEIIKSFDSSVLNNKTFSKTELTSIIENLFVKEEHQHIKNQILDLLTESKDVSEIKKSLINKFALDIKDMDIKQLEQELNSLKSNINNAREVIIKADTAESSKLLNLFNDVEDKFNFMGQMKNNLFLQMPMVLDNKEVNSELFVFTNKNNNKNKNSSGSKSALVALDTLNLGRYEVYINKNKNSVSCQFRVVDENVETLTKVNINKLNQSLKNHGYSLDSFNFKRLEEPFNLLDKQPELISGEINNIEIDIKKITFDMRT